MCSMLCSGTTRLLSSSTCLWLQEVIHPGIVVKIVHVKPLDAAPVDAAWADHCLSVDVQSAGCSTSFTSTFLPCNLLERPQVRCCHKATYHAPRMLMASLHQHLRHALLSCIAAVFLAALQRLGSC